MGQRIDKVRIVKNPNYTFDEEGEDDSVLML